VQSFVEICCKLLIWHILSNPRVYVSKFWFRTYSILCLNCGFAKFWPKLAYMAHFFVSGVFYVPRLVKLVRYAKVCWDMLQTVDLTNFNQTSHVWFKILVSHVRYFLRLVKLTSWAKFCWDMLKIVDLRYFNQPSYILVKIMVSDIFYILCLNCGFAIFWPILVYMAHFLCQTCSIFLVLSNY